MILLHCLQATHETTWNVTHQLHDTSVHLSKTQQVRVLSFFFASSYRVLPSFFFSFRCGQQPKKQSSPTVQVTPSEVVSIDGDYVPQARPRPSTASGQSGRAAMTSASPDVPSPRPRVTSPARDVTASPQTRSRPVGPVDGRESYDFLPSFYRVFFLFVCSYWFPF